MVGELARTTLLALKKHSLLFFIRSSDSIYEDLEVRTETYEKLEGSRTNGGRPQKNGQRIRTLAYCVRNRKAFFERRKTRSNLKVGLQSLPSHRTLQLCFMFSIWT